MCLALFFMKIVKKNYEKSIDQGAIDVSLPSIYSSSRQDKNIFYL